LGTERVYSLINSVQIYDLKNPQSPIGYEIIGSLKVGTVWGNDEDKLLLKFEVTIKSFKKFEKSNEPLNFSATKSKIVGPEVSR
jgi:hypothetical protein